MPVPILEIFQYSPPDGSWAPVPGFEGELVAEYWKDIFPPDTTCWWAVGWRTGDVFYYAWQQENACTGMVMVPSVVGELPGPPGPKGDVGPPGPDYPSPKDNYLLAWTGAMETISDASFTPVAGTVYLQKMMIVQTGTLTTVWYHAIGRAGIAMVANENFVGVYDSSGTLLQKSADCSNAWTDPAINAASLPIRIPLTASIPVTVGQIIYTAVLMNSTDTYPNVHSGLGFEHANLGPGVSDWHNPAPPYLAPNHFRYMKFSSGLATLPATIDLSQASPDTVSILAAVS